MTEGHFITGFTENDKITIRNYSPGNSDGTLAFTVATKAFDGKDADYLTVIVAQGSTNPYELIKDATARSSRTYYGQAGVYKVYDIVDDFYVGINNAFHPIEGAKYKILLTGHSLGGAAANLMAANLIDRAAGSTNQFDVFCYTFGAINSIDRGKPVTDGYESIHNVYNLLDTFSPYQQGGYLPTGMGRGYGKFGQMELFAHDYRAPIQYFLLPQDQILQHVNHDMSNYVEAISSGRVLNSKYRSGANYSIAACPVDVDVYCDGELVGRVVNNEVDASVTSIDISVAVDVKFFIYPDSRQYNLKFTAYDEGTMVFATQDSSTDGAIKIISDVVLESDKQFTSEVGGEIEVEDVRLYVVGDNGGAAALVQEDGSEAAIPPGDMTGDGTVNAADLLRLMKYVNGQGVRLIAAGDMTGDGRITTADLLRLLKCVGGGDAALA